MSTVLVGRHTCWAKGGAWGTVGVYCPDIDVAIAVTVNRLSAPSAGKVLAEVGKVLEAAAPPTPAPLQDPHR